MHACNNGQGRGSDGEGGGVEVSELANKYLRWEGGAALDQLLHRCRESSPGPIGDRMITGERGHRCVYYAVQRGLSHA